MFDGDNAGDRGVVLKYYLYKAIGSPGFYLPILILYMLDNGVTFTEIGAIGMIQSIVVVVGEVPTGYVGDKIGRRNSLLIAQFLYLFSVGGFILSGDFLGFALAFGFYSLSNTFVSGSDQAWLYDILKERLDESTFTHVKGRGEAIRQWVMALTMILGGLLYAMDHVYPFLAVVGMRIATAAILLSMPQNAQYETEDDEENERITIIDALPIIREKLAGPGLRWFVAYIGLFYGIRLSAQSFIQPIAVDTLQESIGSVLSTYGIPEVSALGFLYASFTVVSAIASDYASNIEAALGVRKSLLVIPVVTCIVFVAPVVVPVLAFPMFFVIRSSRSAMGPIVSQYLNDRIESVGRATVLSSVAMVYALMRAPFQVGGGAVADRFTPVIAVATLGGFFLVVGTALFFWQEPIETEVGSATPDGAASE